MAKRLDAREKRFVDEYLIDLDPKRAAIDAGYSKSVAASKAYQWVSNSKIKPHVFEAIAEAKAARSERTEITQDMVLKELAALGFSDMGNYIRLADDGATAFLDWSDLPEGGTKAISEITQETYVERAGQDKDDPDTIKKTKFKLYDKRAALVDIGKHLGMFTERVEHGGNVNFTKIERLILGEEDTEARPNGKANGHAQNTDA